MFSKYSLSICLSLALMMNAADSKAQEPGINISTHAVPFLRFPGDARSAAMGGAGLGSSPDAYGQLWNAAKTVFAKEQTAFGFHYSPWMKEIADGMFLSSLAGYHQFDEENALSFSIRYFKIGEVNITDYSGNKIMATNPNEWSADVSYSRRLSDRFGLGIGFRYILSNLGTASAGTVHYKAGSALAGDLSVYYNGRNEEGKGLTAGLAVSNLGTKIGYGNSTVGKEFLPANLGLGVGYTVLAGYDKQIFFTADLNKLLVAQRQPDQSVNEYYQQTVIESIGGSFGDDTWTGSLGIEFLYQELLAIRAGYQVGDPLQGGTDYITTGLGVRYNGLGVDMSYYIPNGSGVNKGALSNTLGLGLSYKFGK